MLGLVSIVNFLETQNAPLEMTAGNINELAADKS
jgi:hypothetical protein